MKLFIDTSNSERVVVVIGKHKIEKDSRIGKSQHLLEVIDELLQKMGATLKDITEVEVIEGPGSFTGLRVGVSVANSLGWALDLPVNGKKQRVEPQY